MAEWPWRYASKSKAIVHDTPSHASDYLCLIWKESIQNCMCCSWHGKMYHILAVILQSHGWKTLKICVKVKSHCARHTLTCQWSFVPILAVLLLSHGWMTSKIYVNVKGCGTWHTLLCYNVVIICAQYGTNPSRTVHDIGRTWQMCHPNIERIHRELYVL